MSRLVIAWSPVALLVAAAGLASWAGQPPPPAPLTSGGFSESRARAIVALLADEIGVRPVGSEGARKAAERLAQLARAIPRVEVVVQEREGAVPFLFYAPYIISYRVTNVLARLPGRSRDAVLISAHYDTQPTTPGAGDDASGAASAIETLRALADGPPLERTVMVNLNGGEEAGLLGAYAFARHPWFADVRAFVNLDSYGRGKPIVFRSGGGEVLDAYARLAPHPFGSSIYQSLLEGGGVRGAESDGRVYLEHGLPGIDVGAIEDPWVYHGLGDNLARLQPGLLQAMGDNTLATVRALATGSASERKPIVYYDLLGRTMIVYSAATARALGGVALTAVALALGFCWRRRGVGARALAVAVAVQLGAALAAVLGAELVALILVYAARRPHGWYATPWLGILGFAAAALAGALFCHAVWMRRSRLPDETRGLAVWGAALLVWSLLLVLLPVGAAYLALWWLLPGAVGLAWAALSPRAWLPALIVGLAPGIIVTVAPLRLILPLFAGYAGTGYLGDFTFDPVLALLVALSVALFAPMIAPLQRTRTVGFGARLALGLALAALPVIGLAARFTPERPQRIGVVALADTTALFSLDAVDPSAAFQGLPGVIRHSVALPDLGSDAPFQGPVQAVELTPPSLEVVSSEPLSPQGTRRVTLRVHGPGEVRVRVPRARLAGWSLEVPLPRLDLDAENYVIGFLALGPEGRELTLTLLGAAAVDLKLSSLVHGIDLPITRLLPAWTTPMTSAIRTASARL